MGLISCKNNLQSQLGPALNGKTRIECMTELVSREGNVEKIMEAWTRYCSF